MLCRLSQVREDLAGATAGLDEILLRAAEAVSDEFQGETGRDFHSVMATRVYEGRGGRLLLLDDDLVSATTVKVDLSRSGTYATTLTVNTDYWLWPANPGTNRPYRGIELNPMGTTIGEWPEWSRAVQVVGVFGYSNETESGGTIAAAISSTTATTATMTDGHTVEAGDTIWVDTEQMHVSAVAGNTLTVSRGINGTTAATHLILAAVSVRRYPRDVEEAVAARTVAKRWDSQSGYAGSVAMAGDGASPSRAKTAQWFATISRYQLGAVR